MRHGANQAGTSCLLRFSACDAPRCHGQFGSDEWRGCPATEPQQLKGLLREYLLESLHELPCRSITQCHGHFKWFQLFRTVRFDQ